jgi:hypothetical protein
MEDVRMIWNSEWEYNNQDYLKAKYEKKVSGECPDLAVRKIYCKGCGRVFYTQIETKKYCLYSLCGNRGYQKELKWRRKYARKDRICQTCGNTFTPKRSDAKFCCNACRQKAYRGSVTDAAKCQADTLE